MPALSAPLEVFWTLSGLCNLRCTFCMVGSGPKPLRPSLGPAERLAIARELVDRRVLKVYLTGGEPMVLPDFWDLLGLLAGAGIFVELTTNGTHLDPAACRRLKEAGLHSLQVSLNGSDEAANAPLMGPGSFATILAGISNAVAAGLPTHVRPTVQAGNVADLPALIMRLAELGVERVDLREITPLGRAATGFSAQRPDPAALAALELFCASWSHPTMALDFKSWSLAFKAQNHPAVCTLGETRPETVLIDEGGQLAGCSATFYLGFENPVLTHRLTGAWDRLTRLAEFRDPAKLEGECRACDVLDACRGGCRAAAARLTGNVRAPDPLCPRVAGPMPDGPAADTPTLALWSLA